MRTVKITQITGENVFITLFEGLKEKDLYTKYLHLKYQVFVQELGFQMEYDELKGIAFSEAFDKKGKFAIALNKKGEPLGILRAVLSKDGFPKKTLIEHHLEDRDLLPFLDQTATLNVLAVKKEYRSKRYINENTDNLVSIASALSFIIFENLEKCGVKLVFLNATIGATVYVYYKLGFKVIDAPYEYQPNLPPVVNMAIFLPNLRQSSKQQKTDKRKLNLQEKACIEYLELMQKKIFGNHSIWKLFQEDKKQRK